MSDITLESLIQEHKERIGLLKYKPSPKGCIGFGYHYYEDSGVYQKWLVTTVSQSFQDGANIFFLTEKVKVLLLILFSEHHLKWVRVF